MVKRVKVTKKGTDLPNSTNGERDGHIRRETAYDGVSRIYIDLFHSGILDPDEAHIESQAYPDTSRGAKEATEYLRGEGFDVTVVR